MIKLIRLCCLAIALVSTIAAAAGVSGYAQGTSSYDAMYGARVGAGAHWSPAYVPGARASATVGFGGNVALSCSGVDFEAFLRQFKPSELLNQMKDTLISGTQAAVASYLITLAYSNPTLASVLDMMDKKYTTRFDAFAQACNAKQARLQGLNTGASRMAEAENQCFAQQVAQGSSPTEAFRVCSNEQTFGSFDLPALKQTDEFLKRYTSVNVTSEVKTLLNLLPDEQITDSGMKMRPANMTTMQLYSNIEGRAQLAVKAVLNGVDPATIPECKDDDLNGKASTSNGCLPGTAANMVNSPTFLAARLLSPAAAELYTSAMSSQIATTALYSNIYELKQQVSQMDVKENSGTPASEVIRRRDVLLKSIDGLEREAEGLRRVQDSRIRLAKTQIMTLQKAQEELSARAEQANSRPAPSGWAKFNRLFQ